MANMLRRSRGIIFVLGSLTVLFILLTIFNQFGNTLIHRDTSSLGLPLDNSYLLEAEQENTDAASAESDNRERVQHLRRECKHHHRKENGHKYLNYLIVDKKYKMVFCYIPKISCTEWKTIFITLKGKVNSSLLDLGNVHRKYQSHLSFLGSYSSRDQKRILENYKKYIVVRNPLERLLSAYRNKLAGQGFKDYTFQVEGKKIVNRYRMNATRESLKYGNDTTFLEFVKYITDKKTEHLNDHWDRYTTLCRPCLVKYDFIGKFETLSRDADYILTDIGAPTEVRFPSRSKKHNSTIETVKTVDKYYSQVPAEYIKKLWKSYRSDFDLFGYSLSDVLNVTSIPEMNTF